ncbi:MAG TPA: YkvA family protein [Xanthomonadaceae bacterium]|nr:YkvA family protein [Xanthomonadaceae bacterium]
MSIKIQFELDETDLKHFRGVMKKARAAQAHLDDDAIVKAASGMLEGTRKSKLPNFIAERLVKLEQMIAMVNDAGWALPDAERKHVLSALTYFADPQDMIPDDVPVLGFLDDAIMIELVVRELKHEIEAYEDFCRYRAAEAARRGEDAGKLGRVEWAESRRLALLSRMRRRRRSERGGSGGGGGRGSAFTLW